MKLAPYFLTILLAISPSPTEESGAGVAMCQMQKDPETTSQDLRVQALGQLFSKNNSPLTPYAADFVKYADRHGVDWMLLPAISGVESSFGKRLIPNSYNAYGWGQGYIYFESWEDGINTVISSLKTRYINRGADTVYKIGPIYAEAENWSARVAYFMEEIDRELEMIIAS